MKKYLLILGILASVLSCKTRTVTEPPISSTTPVPGNSSVFAKINADENFNQIKINSKVTAETGSMIPPLDAVIYIEKDRKVWMNMVAVFLNIARGIATPDGIKAYEKWNKTYIDSDFRYLNDLLKVNFIDYKVLEKLLLGKSFINLDPKDYQLTRNSSGYSVTSVKNIRFTSKDQVSDYKISMQYSSDLLLSSVQLKNTGNGDEVEIFYSNWTVFENMNLPKNVKIVIKGGKESRIFLENTKFESSKMETPYNVPGNYTKTEIK